MELTYYTSGEVGDAGDEYTGLDRFGRVVDQRWDEGGVDLERVKYGYDQGSNRVWRQNTVAGTGQDEFYAQDGLYQLKTLQRGTLNSGKTGISGTPSWEEDWNHDPLGNWDGPSSGYETKVAGTTTLGQNRTHSRVNEITGITTGSGPAWTVPVHDAAGNMTRAPQPYTPASGYDLMYDAWNRLVQVQVTGGALVATYAYDGASRRVSKTTGGLVRHYYYDDRWRVVEERLNLSVRADRRFTWGIRRLDDLILRDRIHAGLGGFSSRFSSSRKESGGFSNPDGSGSYANPSGSGSFGPVTERLYAVDDAKDVTGVVDTSGVVRERYGYDGFGGVRYMNASFGSIPASAYDWETLFGSYRYDTESGLYQVRFRYLHPLLGRWTSRDPFGYKAGVNLYAYVANGPVNLHDPLGLQSWIGPGYGALPIPRPNDGGSGGQTNGSPSQSKGSCTPGCKKNPRCHVLVTSFNVSPDQLASLPDLVSLYKGVEVGGVLYEGIGGGASALAGDAEGAVASGASAAIEHGSSPKGLAEKAADLVRDPGGFSGYSAYTFLQYQECQSRCIISPARLFGSSSYWETEPRVPHWDAVTNDSYHGDYPGENRYADKGSATAAGQRQCDRLIKEWNEANPPCD